MTTLILLCLALIGTGVFLLAPQARAMGEMSIIRKTLSAVAVCLLMLVSGCASVDPYPVIQDYMRDGDQAWKWIHKHCSVCNPKDPNGRCFSSLPKDRCYQAWANYQHANDAAVKKIRSEREAREKAKREELARTIVEAQHLAKEKVALFREKLEQRQYCEVVLDGTVFLREIQEHNESGLGAQIKSARIPDGELIGIIDVAKKGCNPE